MDAMMISATALSAERTRMNLIASNLATPSLPGHRKADHINARTPCFQPCRWKILFHPCWTKKSQPDAKGVVVMEVMEDHNPPRLQYEPGHPDANDQDYVAYPNVNVVEEMADMMTVTRAYEANVTASKAAMDMQMSALTIGK